MKQDNRDSFVDNDLYLRNDFTSDEVYVIKNLLCSRRTIREVPIDLVGNSPGIKFIPNSPQGGE